MQTTACCTNKIAFVLHDAIQGLTLVSQRITHIRSGFPAFVITFSGCQYHGYWCTGDVRSHGISSHNMTFGLRSGTLLIITMAGASFQCIYEATEQIGFATLCHTFCDVLHWLPSGQSLGWAGAECIVFILTIVPEIYKTGLKCNIYISWSLSWM